MTNVVVVSRAPYHCCYKYKIDSFVSIMATTLSVVQPHTWPILWYGSVANTIVAMFFTWVGFVINRRIPITRVRAIIKVTEKWFYFCPSKCLPVMCGSYLLVSGYDLHNYTSILTIPLCNCISKTDYIEGCRFFSVSQYIILWITVSNFFPLYLSCVSGGNWQEPLWLSSSNRLWFENSFRATLQLLEGDRTRWCV